MCSQGVMALQLVPDGHHPICDLICGSQQTLEWPLGIEVLQTLQNQHKNNLLQSTALKATLKGPIETAHHHASTGYHAPGTSISILAEFILQKQKHLFLRACGCTRLRSKRNAAFKARIMSTPLSKAASMCVSVVDELFQIHCELQISKHCLVRDSKY